MAWEELPASSRRRIVVRSVWRALLTCAGLVALYYAMPLAGRSDVATIIELVVGVLLLIAIVTWEVRAITRSRAPVARALEGLAASASLFIVLFASAYYLIAKVSNGNFGQPLSRTAALYFTVTVFTTVGFGDITAKGDGTRAVVTAQMIADLIFLGVGVKLLTGAAKIGLQHRSPSPDKAEPPER